MNKTQFQILWTIVWFTPIIVWCIKIYVFKKIRKLEEKQNEKPT